MTCINQYTFSGRHSYGHVTLGSAEIAPSLDPEAISKLLLLLPLTSSTLGGRGNSASRAELALFPNYNNNKFHDIHYAFIALVWKLIPIISNPSLPSISSL